MHFHIPSLGSPKPRSQKKKKISIFLWVKYTEWECTCRCSGHVPTVMVEIQLRLLYSKQHLLVISYLKYNRKMQYSNENLPFFVSNAWHLIFFFSSRAYRATVCSVKCDERNVDWFTYVTLENMNNTGFLCCSIFYFKRTKKNKKK